MVLSTTALLFIGYLILLRFLGDFDIYIAKPIMKLLAGDGKGSKLVFYPISLLLNLFMEGIGNSFLWGCSYCVLWFMSYIASERTMQEAAVYAFYPIGAWWLLIALTRSYEDMKYHFRETELSKFNQKYGR